jgi:hypothetical protein
MSKEIILPKTDDNGDYYLSYSQISTWLKSKREYIRQYFFGEDDDNKGLQKYGDFGHKVGESFENNDFSAWDKEETEFLKTIPQYDEFEREVTLKMDGFYLKGFVDTNTAPETDEKNNLWVRKIADYKTGDVEKKGSSVIDYSSDDYLQVEIYAAALRQEFGIAPNYGAVYLIGREGNAFKGEKLKLTKEYITIEKGITDDRLDFVVSEVQRVAEEISEYYKMYLKLNKVV